MGDTLFISAADMQTYVVYLGECYSLGLGVGICTFLMGYGVWLIIDMLRGGF